MAEDDAQDSQDEADDQDEADQGAVGTEPEAKSADEQEYERTEARDLGRAAVVEARPRHDDLRREEGGDGRRRKGLRLLILHLHSPVGVRPNLLYCTIFVKTPHPPNPPLQ